MGITLSRRAVRSSDTDGRRAWRGAPGYGGRSLHGSPLTGGRQTGAKGGPPRWDETEEPVPEDPRMAPRDPMDPLAANRSAGSPTRPSSGTIVPNSHGQSNPKDQNGVRHKQVLVQTTGVPGRRKSSRTSSKSRTVVGTQTSTGNPFDDSRRTSDTRKESGSKSWEPWSSGPVRFTEVHPQIPVVVETEGRPTLEPGESLPDPWVHLGLWVGTSSRRPSQTGPSPSHSYVSGTGKTPDDWTGPRPTLGRFTWWVHCVQVLNFTLRAHVSQLARKSFL